MSGRLLLGTRKGLFRIERQQSGRWTLTQSWFLGDPVTMILPQSNGRRILGAMQVRPGPRYRHPAIHPGQRVSRTRTRCGVWIYPGVPS